MMHIMLSIYLSIYLRERIGAGGGCGGRERQWDAFSALKKSKQISVIKRYSTPRGAGIACWLERQTRDRKVSSSNPGRSDGRIFFSRVNFEFLLLFGIRSIPVLLQWHIKDPGHSVKSASGRLHPNTHSPSLQRSRSGLTIPLSRQSAGTHRETSSHATRQGTLGQSS